MPDRGLHRWPVGSGITATWLLRQMPKGQPMSRRVKVAGDLFHGQVPAGAVYVGRAAPASPNPHTRTHSRSKSTGSLNRYGSTGNTSNNSTQPRCVVTSLDGTWLASAHSASHTTPMCCWSWRTDEPSPSALSRHSPRKLAGMIFRPREPGTFRVRIGRRSPPSNAE